ncbi:MAG TPA: hypothetical protein VIT38_08375 [Allosphingosinicella sp.]
MRKILLLTLLLSAAPALAQQPANGGDNQTITVTGRRIADYRAALAACLARHCPVNEDVDATLALAEVEFEGGLFADARRDVAASLDRNRRHGAAFPEPVADLYRARARVARHLGMDDEAVRSTYNILHTLESGLPQEDYRHYTARLEIAEMMVVANRLNAAKQQLDTLAERARRGNRPDVAALAELRSVWLAYLMAPGSDQPRNRLIAMADDTAPDARMRSTGAKILLARLYRDQGEPARSDALIAEVARLNSGRRNLIFTPPYELLERENVAEGGASNVNTRIADTFDGQWIDVGFWVQPDGHVQDLEILRHRGTPDWANPLLRSIRGRVYSPGPEPTFRLERYTYTAPLERTTGTRLLQRSARARLEYYDLSTGEPPADVVVPDRPRTPSTTPTSG